MVRQEQREIVAKCQVQTEVQTDNADENDDRGNANWQREYSTTGIDPPSERGLRTRTAPL